MAELGAIGRAAAVAIAAPSAAATGGNGRLSAAMRMVYPLSFATLTAAGVTAGAPLPQHNPSTLRAAALGGGILPPAAGLTGALG